MRTTGETPRSFNIVVTAAAAETKKSLRERFDAQSILQAILFGMLGFVSGVGRRGGRGPHRPHWGLRRGLCR